MTPHQRRRFQTGIDLFNRREYWEAHEAWEEVWQECPEESRIFFQGIIQAAAAYHLILVRKRFTGAQNNITKSLSKLDLFPGQFLGLDLDDLRTALIQARNRVEQLGAERLAEFPLHVLPKLKSVKSPDQEGKLTA